MALVQDRVSSPIGDIVLVAEDGALRLLEFDDGPRLAAFMARHFGAVDIPRKENPWGLSDALRAYLKGDLAAIDKLPVRPKGTAFQQRVWAELRQIPAGRTIAYRELAKRAGRPTAIRAAGAANGQNPVSIVIPCHRVVGTDGTLTGYGGGLERKRWLLEHEGALEANRDAALSRGGR
jgi:methylated-DNA-[protein]-cysteine S-methyltransferase